MPSTWLVLRMVNAAKPAVARCTALQRLSPGKKSRVPLGETIVRQAGVGAIIIVTVAETGADAGCLGVGVDVSQRVQSSLMVMSGKPVAEITLLPKVTAAVKHAVEAHGCVPVEPVHEARQVLRLVWFEQVVYMVAHDAQTVEPEMEFTFRQTDSVKQHIPAGRVVQVELAVVTPQRNVVGKIGLEVSGLSWHKSII
jgi:hypothetical protein